MNKQINKLLIGSFTVFALLLPIASQAAAADSIAVVNVQNIVKNSLASKDIQDQLEKKRAAYQAEINKQEEALRKEDKELADQRNVLSEEAYEKKVDEFKKKVADVQKSVQQKRGQLDKAYANAIGKIQEATVSIISELSEKKGFTVAVPTSQVLFAKEGLDISDEVLTQLNKRLPKVKVEVEATEKSKKKG